MRFRTTHHGHTTEFHGLVDVLAKATSLRSGDVLAGCAAQSDTERSAARRVLADVPLTTLLEEPVVPYDTDDVTRLILDGHDAEAMTPVRDLTVGGFREWLLEQAAGPDAAGTLTGVALGLTPEMVAAVSKLMSPANTSLRCPPRPASSPGSGPPSGFQAGCRPGYSPTTPPTTPAAWPRRCSTACSTDAATR